MAAVLEVGAGLTAMSSSRTLQGGPVCNTSVPLRIVCNVTSSSVTSFAANRTMFPTCRGLKIVKTDVLARRLPATISVHSSGQNFSRRIVSEKRDATIGGSPPPGMVTEDTFQKEVLESKIPVLVDFWAPWCGPCRMISPVIDELAKFYAGKLKCLKLNTDDCPHIATEYGIRSIPTVMIFKKGEKKDTVIGAVPRSTLATTVEKYLD